MQLVRNQLSVGVAVFRCYGKVITILLPLFQHFAAAHRSSLARRNTQLSVYLHEAIKFLSAQRPRYLNFKLARHLSLSETLNST